ncbi:hypothetical protein K438DRAFT_2025627 [Mycena galopus ATCC 62051]|nr:hypothetical protein K438DRAFT_2025627 [Mycena galopus ATCC 62051]
MYLCHFFCPPTQMARVASWALDAILLFHRPPGEITSHRDLDGANLHPPLHIIQLSVLLAYFPLLVPFILHPHFTSPRVHLKF